MAEWLERAVRNQANLEAGERILPPAPRPAPVPALAPPSGAALSDAPDIGELADLMQAAQALAAAADVPMPKATARHALALVTAQLRAARGLPPKQPRQTRHENGQTSLIEGKLPTGKPTSKTGKLRKRRQPMKDKFPGMCHARIAATPMPNGCQATATTAAIVVLGAVTTASVARRNIGLTRGMTTRRRAGSPSTATAAAGLCPDGSRIYGGRVSKDSASPTPTPLGLLLADFFLWGGNPDNLAAPLTLPCSGTSPATRARDGSSVSKAAASWRRSASARWNAKCAN